MIKTRIIPTLLYKDYTLVKGVKFDSWRRVGSIIQAVKVYNMRDVDELVFFDTTATADGREPDYELVDDFADECFMPLTVGGGVSCVEHVRKLLISGADKVAFNTAAVENPNLIKDASRLFGSQCIVVSIDAKKINGKYEVYTYSGNTPTGIDPFDLAKKIEQSGAGEIIITSIDKDGTMEGYDLDLVSQIAANVSIPVVASGGAGNYEHMYEALTMGNASAIGAASIFHFTEMTPFEAKLFLNTRNIPVRI